MLRDGGEHARGGSKGEDGKEIWEMHFGYGYRIMVK